MLPSKRDQDQPFMKKNSTQAQKFHTPGRVGKRETFHHSIRVDVERKTVTDLTLSHQTGRVEG